MLWSTLVDDYVEIQSGGGGKHLTKGVKHRQGFFITISEGREINKSTITEIKGKLEEPTKYKLKGDLIYF